MIFDGAFGAPGNENHLADARRVGFFHGVLDQRLVHDGKHFLGTGLGRRKKARTQTRNGKNSFSNGGRCHEIACRTVRYDSFQPQAQAVPCQGF